jgi:hypothetical protein
MFSEALYKYKQVFRLSYTKSKNLQDYYNK